MKGLCHGFGFGVDLKLVVNAAKMEGDGVDGNAQLSRSGLIIVPFDEELQLDRFSR